MKTISFFSLVTILLTISNILFAQQKVVNLSDSADFYYQKKDLKKAHYFYEAFFSSPDSSYNNYNAYYAAVAACHAGDFTKAIRYLKRSASIGYDYLGYETIVNDTLNTCLHNLPEWKTFITNYKNITQTKFAELKKITDGLNDANKRINTSILSNATYWKDYGKKNSAEALIRHIKNFNSYPAPKALGFWTLYNIKVNDTLIVPFLLYIPKNYKTANKTPLYVYLHGGIANKISFSTPAEVPASLEIKVMDYAAQNAFILYPFGKKSFGWLYQQNAFTTILKEIAMVKSFYNIDDNRVYVGGHSNGGSGAFWFAINQPSPFAAFFGLNYLPKIYGSNTPFRNLKNNAPFLGISGNEDPVFPFTLVNEIYKYGVSNDAHWQNFTLPGSHTTTITKRDSIHYLFDTLAAKTREPFPKKIVWETDNVENGRNIWIEIMDLDTLAERSPWHTDLNPSLPQNGKKALVNFNKNKSGAIIAIVTGNTINIQTSRVKRIKLYVSPDMFDMGKQIKLVINDKKFINFKPSADKNVIIDEFLKTKDRDFIVANIIEFEVK